MKKFELNLDALIVVILLFILSLGMNFVQYRLYSETARENVKLQIQGQLDQLNLSSMQAYIDKMNSEKGS
ncbi:hypothetical protein [Amphritea balenae]|uniref:Uncharacterized protein n=1 Tax=Amphritea balenae TaxID=452629 RepID=A0A3P1SP80_9GAMM|nr:hypothetical protein [Amphritea balenae]RRC98937.1 hypothetical protein EHS89_12220 [Amphritea balenae]GGK63035.1 hypothetical protein GCM10007941_11460 [Amphritea balenae]